MTKSKTIAAAIAALTVAASLTVFNGQAQAHHFHHGWGIGGGFIAGTLVGAAVASNYYAPGYAECHYVRRFDRWGNYLRTVKICDVVPY